MAANDHQTYIYVGLAGEGQFVAEGGLYRYAVADGTWQSITKGLPPTPQVRALLIHPDNPAVIYAGTQHGPIAATTAASTGNRSARPARAVTSGRWPPIPSSRTRSTPATTPAPSSAPRTAVRAGSGWTPTRSSSRTSRPTCTPRPSASSASPPIPRIRSTCTPPSKSGACSAARTAARAGPSSSTARTSATTPSTCTPCRSAPPRRAPSTSPPRSPRSGAATAPATGSTSRSGRCSPAARTAAISWSRPTTRTSSTWRPAPAVAGHRSGTEEAGALFRSRDTGETWERVDIGDVPPSRMAKIAVDRAAPNLVSCCAMRGQVYVSQDGGEAWTKTEVPVELSRGRHIYPMVCG